MKLLNKIKVRQCAHIKRVRQLAKRLGVALATNEGVDLFFTCSTCQVQCGSSLGKVLDADTLKIP